MAKKDKMPAKIYVKRHIDGNESWLEAYEDIDAVAEPGEVIKVAVYALVETILVDQKAFISKYGVATK